MTLTRRTAVAAFATATLLGLTGAALPSHAQNWPTKPIRFVVSFAPGGTSEIIARSVAPALMGQITAGKLRPLAVGSAERMSTAPNVPTVAESGYKDFETSQWYGILVPAKTPRALIDRLNSATNQALKSNAILSRFGKDDAKVGGGTPEQFAAFVKREQATWERIVKKIGLKLD